MKNSAALIFQVVTIFLMVILSFTISAQINCDVSFDQYILNSNNIRTSFIPKGNKFYERYNGGFLVPYPSDRNLQTISASAPWIGGYDDAGNLRFAAETYPSKSSIDFYSGPLTSIGIPYDSGCEKFDRVWSVFIEDINSHRQDFEIDAKIDDPIPSIFGWPARKNPFFKQYNGFDLPDNGFIGWADFFDYNNNDIYDPDNGDYPFVRFENQEYIPDQILWMVFNDATYYHTFSYADPFRIEIQLTAFAFHCQDNPLLNNTIFNSYKLIYTGLITLDSVLFGFWTDYNLGCEEDDFIGSDSLRSTEFVYNSDSVDGDGSSQNSYLNNPPVQSMTYLSHPMHSFIRYDLLNFTSGQMYRLLNGTWWDGKPITPAGDGYNPGSILQPTRFLFSGDPRDSNQWAAINEIPEGSDQRSLSSVFLGKINPGYIDIVTTAYIFNHDPTSNHLDQISKMHSNIDALQSSLNDLDSDCTLFSLCMSNNCVWPGDMNHDGIADHHDLPYWGVMKDHSGQARESALVSWRGHHSISWHKQTAEGINYNHGDASGNGEIDYSDLTKNLDHFLFTNRFYIPVQEYPVGNEIVLSSDPIDDLGRIKNFRIIAGKDLENILGMSFELELDTSIFGYTDMRQNWPSDSNSVMFDNEFLQYFPVASTAGNGLRFAAVQRDHQELSIPAGNILQSVSGVNGIYLKSGWNLYLLPDSIIIRIRNLKAIDKEGNDLYFGSNQLVLYNPLFTSISNAGYSEINIYPNPASNEFYTSLETETDAQIFDLNGCLALKTLISPDKATDIITLAPGMYFIKISSLGIVEKLLVQE